MRSKLQEAFDAIKANPELKSQTASFLAHKLYHRSHKAHSIKRFAVAVCTMILLFGGGYYTYMTPVAAISIDVNPSLELQINRYDRVVSVNGYNEDGDALVPLLKVQHLPYPQAIESILEDPSMKGYLAQGELVSLAVVGRSEKQNQQMLAALAPSTQRRNVSCHAVNSRLVAGAHTHGLSFGKYSAYLVLQELDPSITVDEFKRLRMHQIRERIRALSGDETLLQRGRNGMNSGAHGRNGSHHAEHGKAGRQGGRSQPIE